MNLKEHRKDFSRRWNIPLQLDSPEEAFRQFKQRILNAFRHIENQLTNDSITEFCQYYAIDEKWSNIDSTRLSKNILSQVEKENDLIKLCQLIETVLDLDFNHERNYDNPHYVEVISCRPKIVEAVKQAVEMSDVNVVFRESKGRIVLYPEGEKKLDDELVNKTLLFLDPESNKHFENALKFYQSKKHKESAERLRQSVEEFLRHKLKNTKDLPKNIKALQQTLKNNSQPEIRNIIFQVFNGLDKYFNEHSKHGDNVNEAENEFLVYQTGLLLRYINKVNICYNKAETIRKGGENV